MAEHPHAHKIFPGRLAFLLNNPVRRMFSPPERLVSKLNIDRNEVVVDFGCGPGFFLVPLARTAGRAIGVDVSAQMLRRAEKYARKKRLTVQLLKTDGRRLALADNCVDLFLLVHVFHEVEDKARILKEFHRILRPGGRLVIVEKTRPGLLLAERFGPPIVDEKDVVVAVQQGGFTFSETIPYGADSIIIMRK